MNQSSSFITLDILFSTAVSGHPSTVQNCLLNMIDIGQFLYMKYRDIGAKKLRKNINAAKLLVLGIPDKIVFVTKKTAGKPANIIKPNKYGLCFSVNILPSLLAKVRGFKSLVPLNITISIGNIINDDMAIIAEALLIFIVSLKKCAIARELLIPNQKKKFQALSLENHPFFALKLVPLLVFAKSCIRNSYFYIKYHSFIIAKTLFISILFLIAMSIITTLVSCSSAHANSKEELIDMIKAKEQKYNIPSGLLTAIAKTESNLETFALNINGKSFVFRSRVDALIRIRQALSIGTKNIDVGLMQINYKWHHGNFYNVEDMLSIDAKIDDAAKLLMSLKEQYGTWHKAIRAYHSKNPKYNRVYSRKVVMSWLKNN